jgi:hypothetical protein
MTKINLQSTHVLSGFKGRLICTYHAYVNDYKRYLELRGFGDHIHDRFFVKRGFLECWLQPGFHHFWKVWNPGIGYFAYKLYLTYGGKDRRNLATVTAFLVNGLLHNLVVSLLLWRWDFPLPFTFTLFGFLTVISRWLEEPMKMNKWPRLCHLVLNIGLVILAFDFGFFMNGFLQSALFP